MLLPIIITVILTVCVTGIIFTLIFKRHQSSYCENRNTFGISKKINSLLLQSSGTSSVAQRLADFLPNELEFATGVIALYNKDKKSIRRVAASKTKEAIEAINALSVPFSEIEISLDEKNNLMPRALSEKKEFVTDNLYDVFAPALTREEARKIQDIMSIRSTFVFPIYNDDIPVGVFIASSKKTADKITDFEKEVIGLFVDGAGVALQNTNFLNSIEESAKRLQQANERLRELDKLKDDFVSLASHELRTPMTAIRSYLWMALEGKGGPLNDKQRRYIERSYNSADRLIKLVNDMLNISRIDSGRLNIHVKSTNMPKIIQEVIDEIAPHSTELGLTVVQEAPAGIPEVLADSDKIKEVIYNLVGNSLKFTPSGGKITISLLQKNNLVETTIKDTGSGIAPDDISKLFQKFGILPGTYVTNQPAFGTGLGLYICKSIIQMHDGKIWAASDGKGKGAAFTFSLKVFNPEEMQEMNQKYDQKTNAGVGLIHTGII